MAATSDGLTHVSAIIVTRDRPDCIPLAAASVLANNYPSFDLTIVDQSATDATERALESLRGTEPRRFHYVHIHRPGVSSSNNVALRHTTGAVLAFTDDDCLTPVDWLSRIVAAFDDDPEAELLFGEVLPPTRAVPQGSVTPAMRLSRRERLRPERRARLGVKALGGMGANTAARRRLFERIGGYDEALGPGTPLSSGQDWDIAYRALCAGAVVLRRPEIQVIHEYGTRSAAEWRAKLQAYGIGDGAFFCKHIRCGDAIATWLFVRWLVRHSGRAVLRGILRRGPVELAYPQAVLAGAWRSRRLAVDHRRRLYSAGAPPETP